MLTHCKQGINRPRTDLSMPRKVIFLIWLILKLIFQVYPLSSQLCVYYPPWKRGDIGLSLSVRLSVRPSVCPSVRLSVPLDIGYFVHASLVWRSWARAFKFNTHINQGLKSCLVKVLSRSVENCRFWSTLKIVDFKLFFRYQALFFRYQALSNVIHV